MIMTSSMEAVTAWIRSAAIPFDTVEPRQGFKDLEPLRAIIDDAEIVSLGEATHGTSEFRKLKHRLFEFCVTELNFTVLGVELPFPESLAVNAYVLSGIGSAADALAGTRYWIWDTQEMLDVIEWMRWWNSHNARKVKFYGFVTDFPAVAALGLIDYLANVAPDLAAKCSADLAPLTSDFTARLFGQLADDRREAAFACIALVRAAFAQQRHRWIAATSPLAWHLGRLHATVLDQAARFEIDRNDTSHDRVMADHVCALLEAEGPGTKAFLWSHNIHAARARHDGIKSMGKELDDRLGSAQVVIGCSFDHGSFQARTYPTGTIADHSVAAAEQDTFDSALAEAGLPLFALGLDTAPRDQAVAAWLASEMPMRQIGGIYGFPKDNRFGVTYTAEITPRRYFDAVLFVAETTAVRPNHRDTSQAPPAELPARLNLELPGVSLPVGWRTSDGHRRSAYVIAMSQDPSPRGGRTLCMSREAPWRGGDGQVVQRTSARAWQGQRVRFAASVRTAANGVGGGALLFLRFLPEPQGGEGDLFGSPTTVASHGQPERSEEWSTFAVEADVPENAEVLLIGLVTMGDGSAWFGDLEFAAMHRPT